MRNSALPAKHMWAWHWTLGPGFARGGPARAGLLQLLLWTLHIRPCSPAGKGREPWRWGWAEGGKRRRRERVRNREGGWWLIDGKGEITVKSNDFATKLEPDSFLEELQDLTVDLWPTSKWEKGPMDDSSLLSLAPTQTLSMGHQMTGNRHKQVRTQKQKEHEANFCPSDPGSTEHQGVLSRSLSVPTKLGSLAAKTKSNLWC